MVEPRKAGMCFCGRPDSDRFTVHVCTCCGLPPPTKMEEIAEEIRRTWAAARAANGQTEAFRILERMVDRLGYGRTEGNPSLVDPFET